MPASSRRAVAGRVHSPRPGVSPRRFACSAPRTRCSRSAPRRSGALRRGRRTRPVPRCPWSTLSLSDSVLRLTNVEEAGITVQYARKDCDELWIQRGARRAPKDGQAFPGREIARIRSTSIDGHRRGLRLGRLGSDGQGVGPTGTRYSRRVRRTGLRPSRALRGLRRDGRRALLLAVLLDRRPRRERRALRRHRRRQGGVLARYRLGRDDRHGGADGRRRSLGPRQDLDDRERIGDGFVVNGVRSYVTDGNTASVIFVPAVTDKGLSLFAVQGDAKGVARESLATMDQTRKQSRVVFSDAPAMLVGVEGEALAGLETTLQVAAAALAAEQVGGAQRVLNNSVEYAKNRVQFGRPIGSFQAIKHKCADMLLDVESAKSAAYYAAWASQERNDELPIAASLAKSFCSEAYFHCAAENIQIHGGIGFTWEHHAHLYFKRAKSSELFLGDPAYHRELLAQRLGI